MSALRSHNVADVFSFCSRDPDAATSLKPLYEWIYTERFRFECHVGWWEFYCTDDVHLPV